MNNLVTCQENPTDSVTKSLFQTTNTARGQLAAKPAKEKQVKLRLVVDVELQKRDVQDFSTITDDLLGELVKVKSGPYENCFYGTITKVEQLSGKVQRA